MNLENLWMAPPRTWLLLALLLFIALWLLYPQEFIASDPWAYSQYAFEVSQNFDLGDNRVFHHRIAVTLPVAFLYAIFGVNIITTNLWPLSAALLVVLVVWLALPDKRSKIIGAALCLTSVPLFKASTALYPDIIATAFMGLSTLMLFNRERFAHKAGVLAPLTAVFLLFLAFLAKESSYWVLPLWAMAFVADVRGNDKTTLLRQFYLPVLVTGVLLGVGYLVFCHVTWGDPLARFKSIQALTGRHLWAWDKASSWELTKRLTISPVRLLVRLYGAPILALAFLGLAIAPQSLRLWGYYTVFCLLFFWFGPTSFTRYEPMPLLERMTLPLLPGLYILAAFTASHLSIRSGRAEWINACIPILLVLGPPLAQYASSWKWRESAEARSMAIIRQEITKHPTRKHLLVCSDTRSLESLSFYFGYRYPASLRVLPARTLTDAFLRSADKRFVFLHRKRSSFLEAAYGQPNYDDEIDALGLASIYESDGIKLFTSEGEDGLRRLIPPKKTESNGE